MKYIMIILSIWLMCFNTFALTPPTPPLTYITEGDDNDTSVVEAASPNTWVGINDNLTIMGHYIAGLQGLTSPGTIYFDLNGDTAYISSSEFNLGGDIATGGVNFITGLVSLFGWAGGDLEIKSDLDSNIILNTGTGNVFRNTDASPDSTYMTKKYIDDLVGSTDSVGKAYGDDQGNRIFTTYFPLAGSTPFRVFYSNTSGDVTELALGADGTYLRSNGAAANPTFSTPSGSGDLLADGTVPMTDNWPFGDFDLTGAEAVEADTVTATVVLNTPEVNVNGVVSGTITLSGATSGLASITVADEAGTPSEIVLPTSDGSNGYLLSTNGSGVTSWTAGGVDSVGKAYGDDQGNRIITTYLPLAGGTLTGNLGMPGYFINEILAIDVDSGFYLENVEDAGFRSYVQFDLDKMFIGATNVSNVRERVWQFFLSDLTGLTPASLGTPTITGNVDWTANPIPGAYIIEINDLETDDPPNVTNTEIYIGTGAGTGAWSSMSSDVTMTNAGVTTVVNGAVLLDEVGNPSGDKLFNMAGKSLVFSFTDAGAVDSGAFEIEALGAFSGDLLHLHQSTGNPGATHLIHAEAADADVIPLTLIGSGDILATMTGGKVGIGTDAPNAPLEVKGEKPGVIGGFQSGTLHVTGDEDAEFSNSVITGHNSYNTNTQLWYLGSMSSSDNNICIINRQDAKMYFATNNVHRMVIDATGNIGIGGTLSPPEKLSVVGNIATGDTTAGDIDVFHYFSTNGSWTTEYMKWDDGDARFQLSDDLDVTGTIKSGDTLFHTFTLADPDALYAKDTQWGFDPKTRLAITIRSIYVSLDADPTTEMSFSIVFCDAGVGWVSPTTVDDTATVAGVTNVTGGFGDATVPAGKKLYFLFDADPDDAITQANIKIGYTID